MIEETFCHGTMSFAARSIISLKPTSAQLPSAQLVAHVMRMQCRLVTVSLYIIVVTAFFQYIRSFYNTTGAECHLHIIIRTRFLRIFT